MLFRKQKIPWIFRIPVPDKPTPAQGLLHRKMNPKSNWHPTHEWFSIYSCKATVKVAKTSL